MSVTFSIAKEKLLEWNGEPNICLSPIYPEGFDNTPKIDPEYPEYGELYPDNPWELNVTNSNAFELLNILGVPQTEYCGTLCGNDLTTIVRIGSECLATLVAAPELMDMGTPSHESKGSKGCTIIQCGHHPGWYTDRITKIVELATIALAHDACISFC